jgi:hypothetical protein
MKNKTLLYLGIFLIVIAISTYDSEKAIPFNYKQIISLVIGVLLVLINYFNSKKNVL